MWTPERLNRAEHLYDFKRIYTQEYPALVGWYNHGVLDVEVYVYPVDKNTCEVFLEGEEIGLAGTVNEIEQLCRKYCLEHCDEVFDDEYLNEE